MATPDLAERSLPHNLEVEKSILGAVLLDNQAFNTAAQIVGSDDFFSDANQLIFQAMAALSERAEAIDPVTLREELQRRDAFERAGGSAYIASLVDGLPHSVNVEQYARIVKDKSALRQLIGSANSIIREAMEGVDDTDDILDRAEHAIFQISEDKIRKGFVPARDLAVSTMEEIEQLQQHGDHVTGVGTGYSRLDQMTAGLQRGDLVILAARPSMGKTALALNIAQNVALPRPGESREPGVVGFFSLEMSKEQVMRRLVTAEAQVDAHKLATGFLSREDVDKLVNSLDRLSGAPIFIDDTAGSTVLEMRAKTRRLKAEHGCDLVVVDYLQLVRAPGRHENRNLEIGEISRSLKAMAKEMEIPVLALSQLSRAPESRAGHRPQLSDLRECVTGDTLVQLADGRRVPIARLEGTTPKVVAMSPNGQMTVAESDKVWRVGKRQVMSVRLASGRRIRATARHRFFGATGWTRLERLSEGDRLAIPRQLPEPADPEEWSELRVALLGQLIGDGSYLRGQPMRYTTSSEANSEIVARAAREEFGAEVKRYPGRGSWHQLLISGNGNRWHPAGVNEWLRDLGIFGQRSHEKRVPERAFRLSNDQVALLLRHMWATDGCIAPKDTGGHAVHYATSSPELAADVAALLLRLGIVARTYEARKAHHRVSFLVCVQGTTSQCLFLERVGAFGPKAAGALRLEDRLRGAEANTNVDTLPIEVFDDVRASMQRRGVSHRAMAAMRGTSYGGSAHFAFAPSREVLGEYAELLDDDGLRAHVQTDLFWDRIVSIEPDGEEDVYDLTVPGPASWVGNAVISHNSGNLEQDADVVSFIFRPEVYDREDPELEGRAELIISKQRNGPIGSVPLVFLKQFTLFRDRAEGMGDEDWG